MTGELVVVDADTRRDLPWLPWAAPPGSVWLAPTGEAALVLGDGGALELGPGQAGGAYTDPCSCGVVRRAG